MVAAYLTPPRSYRPSPLTLLPYGYTEERMTTRDDLLASVEAARQEIIDLCQALVRIPTVSTGIMPTGDELPAAELLRDKLAADGLDGDIFISAPNRGNYIATMRGSAGAPRLLYLSHTDVVPVEDEAAWTHPPFGAEIHEGRIYGRGSNDMKNTVAAEAMAMILLKRAGIQLRGDLIFAAGADEETGGVYGFEWLAKHHGDLLRADFGINEGGGALVHAPDGRLAYLVSTGEKGRLEIVITVKGRGFHASQPWRADNAIYKSQEVISRIAAYQPEIHVDPGADRSARRPLRRHRADHRRECRPDRRRTRPSEPQLGLRPEGAHADDSGRLDDQRRGEVEQRRGECHDQVRRSHPAAPGCELRP